MKIRSGWTETTKELMTREDLFMILSSNLVVANETIPEGKAGQLYAVGGMGVCCDAIMDLLERRIQNKEEKDDRVESVRAGS